MNEEKTELYKNLSKQIKNTKYILELIDLGYDITQSRFLGKTDIIDLCNEISDKINKITNVKHKWCYGKMDMAIILDCGGCDKDIQKRCYNLSFDIEEIE